MKRKLEKYKDTNNTDDKPTRKKRRINHLKNESIKLRVKRLLVMTTQSVDFFLELGFSQISLDEIPPERPRDYDQTRNSRILMLEI